MIVNLLFIYIIKLGISKWQLGIICVTFTLFQKKDREYKNTSLDKDSIENVNHFTIPVPKLSQVAKNYMQISTIFVHFIMQFYFPYNYNILNIYNYNITTRDYQKAHTSSMKVLRNQ